MSVQFLVFRFYLAAWFRHAFIRRPKTKKQFAAYNLFQSTFRIPQSNRAEKLLVLKKYFEVLKMFFKSSSSSASNEKTIEQQGDILIYDLKPESYVDRKEYVEYFSGQKVAGGAFKDNLAFIESRSRFFFLLLFNFCWLPVLFIYSLFKKDKAPVATLFKEQVELVNLINLIKLNNFREIYYFCIYEKDSNITSLLLNYLTVKVNKIPSEVPLGIWNKIIIADTLCLCNGYQYDEVNFFKDSMFVEKLDFYGPEQSLLNIGKYSLSVPAKKKVIGFYSTGAWVRKLEDHIDQGYEMEGMEERVKHVLRKFCMENSQYTVKIFLHPREKWEKYTALTRERYNKVFEGVTFEFCDFKKKSAETFEEADFAVAFKSTIVFERLYYGFKTLLMPLGWPNFPVQGSKMALICADSDQDLFEKIEKNITLSNREFFEQNGIKHFAKFLYN
ncbi:MAG: hypothetical protein Q8M29_03900 [Bacteroidota bacterium]|nr:hypothetical protein [Bacteroidota bacterium]